MKKALPLILLGAAALLFCFGVGALALNFFGNRAPAVDLTQWKTPIQQVDVKKINPAVALAVLAGVTDSGSVDDTLASGDFEGAFAQIAFGSEFSDANRAGTLLLLGSRYAAAKQIEKAAWMYQYAVFIATVSPQPSDLTRVQTLLEAAQGLKAINMDAAARSALDQAYLISQNSFSIPRDTRADTLEQVGSMYSAFGVPGLAAQARQRAGDIARLTEEDAIATARRPFLIQPTNPPEFPELRAKLKERVAAARELLDAINLNPPKTPDDLPDDLVRALGDKLYEEDGLRADYFSTQYNQAPDASAQLGLLRDKIKWLTLKHRIARGGFGISLVPEWETDVDNIVKDLNDAYADYFQITEQQATGLEKSDEANRSVEDVLRSSIVAGRWGLYPDFDETDLRARLDQNAQALRDDQVPSLRLDTYTRGDKVIYLLVPDELYGQGEKALPRQAVFHNFRSSETDTR